MRRVQFRIRDVMVLAIIISLALGMVVEEPLEIALAALFCGISCCVVMTLFAFSIFDFWSKIRSAVEHRTFRPFIGRIKWLVIDTIILVWTVAIISISNYIFANCVHRGPWLVLLGALGGAVCGPIIAWSYTRPRP